MYFQFYGLMYWSCKDYLILSSGALKRLQTPKKHELHIHTTKKVYPFYLFFPLFWTILYDRYIPKQTSVVTLLRNAMLTVPKGAWANCAISHCHEASNLLAWSGCKVTAEIRGRATDKNCF